MHKGGFASLTDQYQTVSLMASPDSALNSLGRKGNQSSPGTVWLKEKSFEDSRIFSVSILQRSNSSCILGVRPEQPCLGKRLLLCPCAQSLATLVLADTHLPLYLAQLVSLDLLPEGRIKEQGGGTVVNQA